MGLAEALRLTSLHSLPKSAVHYLKFHDRASEFWAFPSTLPPLPTSFEPLFLDCGPLPFPLGYEGVTQEHGEAGRKYWKWPLSSPQIQASPLLGQGK